jgi:hypothetical protein
MANRALVLIVILACLIFPVGCEELKLLSAVTKPEAHILIAVQSDRSAMVSFDFASGMFEQVIREYLDGSAQDLATEPTVMQVQVGTTRWYGREFTSLQVQFASLESVNTFFNAPALVGLIVERLGDAAGIPAQVPAPFDQFELAQGRATDWRYVVRITPSAELRELARYVHLECHVGLPYGAARGDQNATESHDRTLTWDMDVMQGNTLYATSRRPLLGGWWEPEAKQWRQPWLLGVGGVLLLGSTLLGAMVLIARRRGSKTKSPSTRKRRGSTPGRPGRTGPPPPPPGRL